MAKSDGSVIIDTRMDTVGFGKGVKSMKSQMSGLTSAIGKLGAAIGLAFGVKALVDFGKSAIELGSDLQEVQNVVDVTFTTMSESVNEFAKNAAEAAGLSETMAKKYMGTFGAMSKAFGFMEDEAFAMSSTLTQAVGDVASFYNLTQDEAYTKLKSVFTGETESLKDLGVVMTQSALDSYAMAEGYGKTTKQMSEQEKVALRYAFVLDQLSASQGDFVRTSDSWANQTRVLSLNFDTLKANIGQALINIFTPFLKMLNQIVDKMSQLSQRFVAFSEMLVGKSTSGGGGSPGDAVKEIAQGFDDVADATKEAEKAQKKYLSGLDEIRAFQSPETESGNTTTGIVSESFVASDAETMESANSFINNFANAIKNGDWESIGELLSSGFLTALNFLNEKLDAFDWQGLGQNVGKFIKGIKWGEILKSALELKINIWKLLAETWFGAFTAAPFETAIFTAFATLKLTPLGGIVSSKIISALGLDSIGSKIGEVFALTIGGAGTFSEAVNAVFGPLTANLLGISSVIGGAIAYVTNFFDMLKNGFSWLNEILMIVGVALGAIGAVILGAPALVAGVVAAIIATVSTIIVIVKDNWDAIVEVLSNAVEWLKNNVVVPIGNFLKDLCKDVAKWFSDLWSGIKKVWKNVADWFNRIVVIPVANFFGGLWNGIKSGASVLADFMKNKVINPIVNLFKGMYNSIVGIMEGIINGFIGIINSFIKGINNAIDAINAIPGVKLPLISTMNQVSIPKLANGAVIPPNAPFMAMLGDQKHGTNIEAPLDTIKQAVREVVGNGGGQYAFTAQINRRTLFEEMIDEAKLRQSTSGRNPFELA